MASKGNFTKALLGVVGFEEVPDDEILVMGNDVIAGSDAPAENNALAESNEQTDSDALAGEVARGSEDALPSVTYHQEPTGSHITSTMVVTGNIKAKGDIFVEGSVYGDIATDGDISVRQLVIGDLKADSVYLDNARVKGNVKCEERACVGDETILVGDVEAHNIQVSGKVKGNLKATGSTALGSTALVSGDITTEDISSNSGARLNGTITTSKANAIDDDSMFDLGDDCI